MLKTNEAKGQHMLRTVQLKVQMYTTVVTAMSTVMAVISTLTCMSMPGNSKCYLSVRVQVRVLLLYEY